MKTAKRHKAGGLKATPWQRQEIVRAFLYSEGWADPQRRSGGRWYVRAAEGSRFMGIEADLVEAAVLAVRREAAARLAALKARAKARESEP